uniref:Keratin-associated protein n=1 Tax=Ornithorhynchus anatinus TaxID=9258 RepID=A0A6I8PJX4_ORNAN
MLLPRANWCNHKEGSPAPEPPPTSRVYKSGWPAETLRPPPLSRPKPLLSSTMSPVACCSAGPTVGGLCPVPAAPSVTFCSGDVSCGDALCLPGACPGGSWLLDNCQETCCEPSGCGPVGCGPGPCYVSSGRPSSCYVSGPGLAVSCLPLTSYGSGSCAPACGRPVGYVAGQFPSFVAGGCRPLTFVSAGCRPQNLVSGSCYPLSSVSSSCRPVTFLSSSRPQNVASGACYPLSSVSSGCSPLGYVSSGCRPLTYVSGSCRPLSSVSSGCRPSCAEPSC